LGALVSGADGLFTATDAQSIKQLPCELPAVRRLEELSVVAKAAMLGEEENTPSSEVLQVGCAVQLSCF
jgi:hypothetical protein